MWNRIVHPRLLSGDFADLSDFFASACTIQEAVWTPDAAGEEAPAWADKAGHVDIPCTIAPEKGRGDGEVKQADGTFTFATHHVTLAGCYPLITSKMKAVVNGTALDILLAESDSQAETTRLACRLKT
ncbi:MAG: head-tail adaptor protein [Sphaerochaeta sp.]|jgi:hypothetical protein|nr:head-tail adaptor protein [Sphaerochaeta sp.]